MIGMEYSDSEYISLFDKQNAIDNWMLNYACSICSFSFSALNTLFNSPG